MSKPLDGEIALVTGASRGIGAAIADTLAGLGAKVIGTATSESGAQAISELLYQDSGLYGVSGISDDMRTLLASDDPHAELAVDLYLYRIRRELGSLAAALGGLDAIAFTGGVGVDVEVGWIGGGTIRATGNSFATPCIAGIAALVLSKHPELTPFQLKSVLYLTATNVGGGT